MKRFLAPRMNLSNMNPSSANNAPNIREHSAAGGLSKVVPVANLNPTQMTSGKIANEQLESGKSISLLTPFSSKPGTSGYNVQRNARTLKDRSVRVLTVSIRALKQLRQSQIDIGPALFEIFGVVDASSFIKDYQKNTVRFSICSKDGTEKLECIFYEMDRPLSAIAGGQLCRMVGSLPGGVSNKSHMVLCLCLRVATATELRHLAKLCSVSAKAIYANMMKPSEM